MAYTFNGLLVSLYIQRDANGVWKVKNPVKFAQVMRERISISDYEEWRAGGNPVIIQELQRELAQYSMKIIPFGKDKVAFTSL